MNKIIREQLISITFSFEYKERKYRIYKKYDYKIYRQQIILKNISDNTEAPYIEIHKNSLKYHPGLLKLIRIIYYTIKYNI